MPFHEGPLMLETMGGEGAAEELFQEGLTEVKTDINNAKKKTTAKRSFSIKFTFSADENGCSTRWTMELSDVKRAPNRAVVGSAVISHEHGTLEMLEVRQTTGGLGGNVVAINKDKE